MNPSSGSIPESANRTRGSARWVLLVAGALVIAAGAAVVSMRDDGFHPSTHTVTIHETATDGLCSMWATTGENPWRGTAPAGIPTTGKLTIKTPNTAVFKWQVGAGEMLMARHGFPYVACAG